MSVDTFDTLKLAVQTQVNEMFKNRDRLFVADVNPDDLYEQYLQSFPEGTNPIFRTRTEHDCGCCKQFIRQFGAVVALTEDNNVLSVWDVEMDSDVYSPVAKALSQFVKAAPIAGVFVTKEKTFGTDRSREKILRTNESGKTFSVKEIVWEHFYTALPKKFQHRGTDSVESVRGEFKTLKEVFLRSMTMISEDALNTILDLIAQGSLYRGEEWDELLKKFLDVRTEFYAVPEDQRDVYSWRVALEVGPALAKIKNHVIGTLLVDVTDGMDLETAVVRYEKKTAPENYKRPNAIFSQKMLENAQKLVESLGLTQALQRRFANPDDISVNNILFVDADVVSRMQGGGGVFGQLARGTSVDPKAFDRVEDVPVAEFLSSVLPRVSAMEVLVENRHIPNLMSLMTAQVPGSGRLFKWENEESWAYRGNVTDSLMKQRVKAVGGITDAELRFSIRWNEKGRNPNDYDAHAIEPGGNRIDYRTQKRVHKSSGVLDIDYRHFKPDFIPVENIVYSDRNCMLEGEYVFGVHCFEHLGGTNGFSAEIEFDGQIRTFEYRKNLKRREFVPVAKVRYSHTEGFSLVESLDGAVSSQDVWGLTTQQFHPVSLVSYSPNYWDEQHGIGHRHILFFLKGCVNDGNPSGFFNEFLRPEFVEHRKVFEALTRQQRVADTDDQLSGIGFSSTKRNSVLARITGNTTRVIRINF